MKKKSTPSSNRQSPAVRGVAAQVLQQVHAEGRSLSTALPLAAQTLPENQQPFLQELCYGSLRWFSRIEALIKQLLQKPIRNKERIVYYLLLIGLYQLIYSNKPDYAVVQETVAELQKLNKGWAKGLVNAVLRRFLREREVLLEKVDKIPAQQLAHPQWLIDLLVQDWKSWLASDESQDTTLEYAKYGDWREILAANNHHPPFWLRLNQQQCPLDEYLVQLSGLANNSESGHAPERLGESLDAIRLSKAHPVDALPGFREGWVSVQDGAAQFAAHLLDAQAQERVLDVCAAPGGKTIHILQRQPCLKQLLALDISSKRLQQVEENLQRCRLHAEIKAADAAEVETWWDGKNFDRVLLDAPCSATGVIRRHPDIKVLRRADDIQELVNLQQQILENIWKTLKPGGILLYATCSVLRDENDRQMSQFLTTHADAQEDKFQLNVGRAMPVGWQILPGEGHLDGFYYARIKKQG